MKRTITALAVLIALTASAYGAYRITLDPGGQIDQYHQKYTMLRDAGGKIEIDGLCISACTMILGLIPPENVCVTERARLCNFDGVISCKPQTLEPSTRCRVG